MDTPGSTPAATTPPKAESVNRIGLTLDSYKGAESTLCAGCGHNSVTAQIIRACFMAGVEPHKLVKLSGIGCSSRTPAFFVRSAHGFNSVHGRMPPLATGVAMANKHLQIIGVSGDGDTASIGMSHYIHTVRRNTDMVYLIENNGVYSLTKGQLSATADVGSRLKNGQVNDLPPIDCCGLAIELGCGFVARSFSADAKQLYALLMAALQHKGTAVLDVLSPCITFNNHDGSTKSYKCLKDKETPLHELDVCEKSGVQAEAPSAGEIDLGNGYIVRFKKVGQDYDPTDLKNAYLSIERARSENLFLTGLLYRNPARQSFKEYCNTVDEPLATLPLDRVRPSEESFENMLASFA